MGGKRKNVEAAEACDVGEPAVKKPVAMDKAAASKMLGYMKYHARATSKDMGDRDDASFALAKYNALKGVDKLNFLKSYEQNKGSLKWARSFTSTSTEIESRKAGGRTTGG